MYDNRHTSFSSTPLQLQVKQEHSNRNGDLVFTHVQPVPGAGVKKISCYSENNNQEVKSNERTITTGSSRDNHKGGEKRVE